MVFIIPALLSDLSSPTPFKLEGVSQIVFATITREVLLAYNSVPWECLTSLHIYLGQPCGVLTTSLESRRRLIGLRNSIHRYLWCIVQGLKTRACAPTGIAAVLTNDYPFFLEHTSRR